MEQASNAKYVVVVVGGGAGGIKFLQAAAKLSDDVKSQLDIVIIDTKDYNETPVSMQRFLTQPEKARYATLPYSEVLQAVGIGRFIQGRVVKVSKAKSRVHLQDGTRIRFDYCLIATGESYNSHPWLNRLFSSKLDTTADSALATAVKNDLSSKQLGIYKAFSLASGIEGVEFRIIRDFLSRSASADLLSLLAYLVSGKFKAARKLARSGSDAIESFFATQKSSHEDLEPHADGLISLLKSTLAAETAHWASRGQIRESAWEGPLRSRTWRLEQLASEHAAIESANDILVLGGGVIAIEVASDLADRFPGKKITIIHRGNQLLDRSPSSRAKRNINWFFRARNVQVILNEQVSAWRSVGTRYAVQTGNGQIMEFDKIIVCWGGEAQSSFLQSEFASSIDPHTMKLSVDPYLRLSDTVFAVGDVTTADYPRTTPALIQGELTLHNIAALIRGKPLQAYKRQRDMGLITLGVTMTIFIVGGWCLMANTLGMGLKAKGEKKFFGEWGQTWGFDVDWAKDISDKAALYASGNKVGSSSREEL